MRKKIGIIIGKVYNVLNNEQLRGITQQAFSLGYSTYIFTLTEENQYENYSVGERNLLNMINFDELDGVIVVPHSFSSVRYAIYIEDFVYKKCRKPVISVTTDESKFDTIWIDDRRELCEITSHLIEEHGCRKLYCLTGPFHLEASKARAAGFRDAMGKAGLMVADSDVIEGDFWSDAAQKLADEIISGEREKPDAVVCASDVMAIALCDALIRGGISVPEQVRITGYDNSDESIVHSPQISTYNTRWAQLGVDTMCALYKLISGTDAEPVSCEKGEVLCRESCSTEAPVYRNSFDYFRYQNLNGCYLDSSLSSRLLSVNSLGEFIQAAYDSGYVYKENWTSDDKYSICLCEDWNKSSYDTYAQTYRTTGYTPQMMHMHYFGDHTSFDISEMVPEEHFPTDEPCATLFTAIHFQERCFGYALFSTRHGIKDYNEHYLRFTREINNALEMLCVQNELKSLAYRNYISQIRDDLTGLYKFSAFRKHWGEFSEKAKLYGENPFAILVTINGISHLRELHGNLEEEKMLSSFADILLSCCRNHEKCMRTVENDFVIVGVETAAYRNPEMTAERIARQFEQYLQNSGLTVRMALRYSVLSESCASIPEEKDMTEKINKGLKELRHLKPATSEQLHYKQLVLLRNDIYTHPEQKWSIEVCSERLNVSVAYFQRIYRKAFNVSCASDIQHSRLSYAKKLLIDTNYTLQTIAAECGYEYSHFMRTFKKEEGVTPTEFRKGITLDNEES